jgi:DNA polymerase sigma
MKLIERATIPVIKLKTETERIPTDITFHWDGASASSAHSGLAARDLVKSLLGRLPPLGALTLVTKQLLHERGLNDTFSGGLGSYCLVLLIAVFLDVASNEHKISSPQLSRAARCAIAPTRTRLRPTSAAAARRPPPTRSSSARRSARCC